MYLWFYIEHVCHVLIMYCECVYVCVYEHWVGYVKSTQIKILIERHGFILKNHVSLAIYKLTRAIQRNEKSISIFWENRYSGSAWYKWVKLTLIVLVVSLVTRPGCLYTPDSTCVSGMYMSSGILTLAACARALLRNTQWMFESM